MKLTFVSNYINHHQMPLSNALYEALGEDYTFVQMEPMEEERIRMGWGADCAAIPYLRLGYEQPQVCRGLIEDSDIVIWGGYEEDTWLQPRLRAGKPTIRYSERFYKEALWKAVSPRGLWKKYHDHTRYRRRPVYLLCAGAYVPLDYHIIRSYPEKMFRWGYFPENKHHDVDNLLQQKSGAEQMCEAESDAHGDGKPEILWVGRMIDWKHPELAVELAFRLKKQQLPFHMTMIGNGPLEAETADRIVKQQMEKEVTLAGSMPPDQVRTAMERADIVLMTSDRNEGWGAVANEAMNSGCVLVAGHMEGAIPYLVEDGVNGFIYRENDITEMTEKVSRALRDRQLRCRMGRRAYETISERWNAGVAAGRLLDLCSQILEGGRITFYEDGPLSKAPILRECYAGRRKTGRK